MAKKPTTIIARRVQRELGDLGIYLHNKAVTTTSWYFKFKDERIRSLTVRDHKTKPEYRYKWNIVIGYTGPKKVLDRGVPRYFYSENEVDEFLEHVRRYYQTILKNESNSAQQVSNTTKIIGANYEKL
ncbi:hypothetical protein [Sphaerochaeta globosa]|uniref:Uncharacterized protein n=1 Tax=Sphaerochaeta globosa (strain ATCC BAA-1886 / DSM 22777 / Buddy) TaxID=158189 RepID=F0RWM1_SPHGB|nr:hypothetical protein [Sphaerochaeta globosa]ADY13652.1 hypothetical protein SpiBuddy_1828 [Sphaerochaeta globosa str. Buddy]